MHRTTTEEGTMTANRTCTVRTASGTCGKPAVYTEGEFAECAECAAAFGSMASTRHMVAAKAAYAVGDPVVVHRYGKAYNATVTYVGKGGRVRATFRYGNGAERTVDV